MTRITNLKCGNELTELSDYFVNELSNHINGLNDNKAYLSDSFECIIRNDCNNQICYKNHTYCIANPNEVKFYER